MIDGRLLDDHAAHRVPDPVGRPQLERVEQCDGVLGQVGQRVGGLERLALKVGAGELKRRQRAGVVEVG